ncbi:MAG: hypothetical protein F6K09_04650 [Merismopedia sp. SIO2A8]|nr:hypothetical protein [Merismopedia sp. SIO2A8]
MKRTVMEKTVMAYRTAVISLAVALGGWGGWLYPINASAQTRLSPEPRVWEQPNNVIPDLPTDPSIYFMVAGPTGGYAHENLDPTRWRLALSCAEIYCGIDFDYIEEQGEYEGLPRIVATYHLPGADIAPTIGTESRFLHNLHFVAWEAWDRVLLREGDRHFRIQMNPDHSFTITPILRE